MPKRARAQTPPSAATVPTGFDQVLHLRYRLHLQGLLGLQTLAVYDTLRSFIWRQDTYGPDDLCDRAQRGFLVAKVTQQRIAEVSGVPRPRVNLHLRKLAKLGWLVSTGKAGGERLYELGIRRPQGATWAEVTYADSVQQGWYEAADAKARAAWGVGYRKLSPANQIAVATGVLEKAGALPQGHLQPVIQLAANSNPKETDGWFCAPLSAFEAELLFKEAVAEGLQGGVQSLAGRGEGVTPGDRGVSPDVTGCEGSNVDIAASFQGLAAAEKSPIHNVHRMPLPTGEGSDTSYLILLPFGLGHDPSAASVSSAESGQASPALASALAPFGSLRFDVDSGLAASVPDSFPEPEPEQTPKPPAPPAPLSPVVTQENLGDRVTRSGGPVSSPPLPMEQPRVTPPERPSPAKTPRHPAPPANEAPEAARGAGEALPVARPDLASVLEVVEAAKARSRAAVEVKLAKQRTKERKKTNLTSDAAYRSQKPGALRIEQAWREEMAIAFPDVPQIAWFKREHGKLTARKEGKLVADLLEGYGGDEASVEKLVRGFVTHWDKFGPMLTKTKDGVPTIGLLYACHASVMSELRRLVKAPTSTPTEYADWLTSVKHDPFAVPPPELLAAHKAAKGATKK